MTCVDFFFSIVCSALTASYLLWFNEVLLTKLALTRCRITDDSPANCHYSVTGQLHSATGGHCRSPRWFFRTVSIIFNLVNPHPNGLMWENEIKTPGLKFCSHSLRHWRPVGSSCASLPAGSLLLTTSTGCIPARTVNHIHASPAIKV